MIAPEVVIAQRLHITTDGKDRRSRGVERNRQNLIAPDRCLAQYFARSRSQCAHVIMMRLRGVFWIFALAMQRIFLDSGGEQSAFAVDEGDAHAQSSEIDTRYNRH